MMRTTPTFGQPVVMKDEVSNVAEAPIDQYPPSGWPREGGEKSFPNEGT